MNLFGTKQKVTKDSIAAKSQGALGMFKSAIESLEESNAEALILATENQKIIDNLTNENHELHSISAANENIIKKIEALIS